MGKGRSGGKRRSRSRREALVHAHLEHVSRKLLEEHPDIVRRFIGKNAGVYALYRKSRLYYVGLAIRLSGRLKAHIRDRHGESWDNFSIFLTIKNQHLKEIECLLLQMARPPGNRIGGNPTGSKDMRRWIKKAIRQKQEKEVSSLFIRKHQPRNTRPNINQYDKRELAILLPQGARLKGTNKSQAYYAVARPDGTVRYNGDRYTSLSLAAGAALKRPTNGWWFWQVERGRRNWVRLTEIRRAGTPVFSR